MAGKKRVGVVLFQLGGPDSFDAVEPFLRNLFLDPDIIPMGPLGFLRGPLARYIAKKRSVSVAGRYAMSWISKERCLCPKSLVTWSKWRRRWILRMNAASFTVTG